MAMLFFWRRRPPPVDYSDDERKVFDATQQIAPAILWAGVVGGLALLLWAIGQAGSSTKFDWGKLSETLGLYLLIAGAASAVGGLAGFLFGIPRTRDAVEAIQQGEATKARRAVLAANTNLERVSDWLTTLLLGATLVQIEPLAKWVGRLGEGLQAKPVETLMPIIVVFFAVLGFLGVYLMTRLYLSYALQLMLKLGLEGDAAPPTLEVLRTGITEALDANDEAKLRAALSQFDTQRTRPEVSGDTELNARAARAAGRLSKVTGIDPKEKEALHGTLLAALRMAVADSKVKQELQANIEHKRDLEGLDDAVQAEVRALLESPGSG